MRDATCYLSVVRMEAGKVARKGLPAGVDRTDLESAGGEVLAECLASHPVADEGRFLAHLRLNLRTRLIDEVRRLTHRGLARTVTLTAGDGGEMAVRDDRADDPAEVAALADLVEGLPSPWQVAAKAARLKAAVLAAVSEADVGDIVRAQVQKAKAGNTKAFEAVMKLVDRR